MSEIRTSAIWFDSANGKDRVAGYYYDVPDTTPRAVVQISHGMCEYIGRYQDFADVYKRQSSNWSRNAFCARKKTLAGEKPQRTA